MPDVVTGLPRPPRAPREWKGHNSTPEDREPRKPPPGPEQELGPILEWNQPKLIEQLRAIGVVLLLYVGFLTWRAGGLEWVGWWWAWAILGPTAVWYLWDLKKDSGWVAAGAQWVQQNNQWVNTYELEHIRFTVNGLNRVIRLTDASGRRIALVLRTVQINQPMWDLVYNGILHSVASGACDISPKARKVLKIPADLCSE